MTSGREEKTIPHPTYSSHIEFLIKKLKQKPFFPPSSDLDLQRQTEPQLEKKPLSLMVPNFFLPVSPPHKALLPRATIIMQSHLEKNRWLGRETAAKKAISAEKGKGLKS